MLEREKLVIEGAAGAAVLNKKMPFTEKLVGVIVNGGNFDVAKLGESVLISTDDVDKF